MTNDKKNRIVAEKIMGYTVEVADHYGESFRYRLVYPDDTHATAWYRTEADAWADAPDFSDWPGVPLLLARLSDLKCQVQIYLYENIYEGRQARVVLLLWPPDLSGIVRFGLRTFSSGQDEMLPLALREAALALVEVDDVG